MPHFFLAFCRIASTGASRKMKRLSTVAAILFLATTVAWGQGFPELPGGLTGSERLPLSFVTPGGNVGAAFTDPQQISTYLKGAGGVMSSDGSNALLPLTRTHLDLPATRVLADLAAAAAAARYNNPRVLAPMGAPPGVTSSASPDGTLSKETLWNAATPVFNYYGGVPTADGAGGAKFPSATVTGVFSPYVWRLETIVDAVKVQFKVIDISGVGVVNFIVDGRYISTTAITPGISGVAYITLDFTTVGGRKPRSIIMEAQTTDFISASVLPTEGLAKPPGTVIKAYLNGESFAASGGMVPLFNGYVQILADHLGIRDIRNGAVGGTGYLSSGVGETTCRQRGVSDAVAAGPDIIILACGHNDSAFTPAAIQAEVTAYLAAMRAQPTLSKVPIIVLGILGGNVALATTQPRETAIAAAVTAFNDPLVFFVSDVNSVNGPYITGSGNTSSPTGTGNADIYISSDAVHPNNLGHAFYASRIADDIMRLVLSVPQGVEAGSDNPSLSLGAVAPTKSKKLCVFGDSITANADQTVLPQYAPESTGSYATWLNVYTKYRGFRAPLTNNFGVSGNTTGQMLVRLPDVLAAKCDIVVFQGGTNDVEAGVSGATITANLSKIFTALLDAGVEVIDTTIFPRSGSFLWNATKTSVALRVNSWRRNYAKLPGSRGFHEVDLDPLMADPASATWASITGQLADGVHPSTTGGSVMAAPIAAVINSIVPAWLAPTMTASDAYDATNNPAGNLVPNGVMAGTGGTTDTCTGTSPNSAVTTATPFTAVGGVCALSITALSDGTRALQIDLSGTPTTTAQMEIDQLVVTPGNVVAGDVVRGLVWVNLGATNTNLGTIDPQFSITVGGVSSFHNAFATGVPDAFPTGGFIAGMGYTIGGVEFYPLMTDEFTVPAGTVTSIKLRIFLGANASGDIASTIQTIGWELRKVNP